jgi:hypothetical protein
MYELHRMFSCREEMAQESKEVESMAAVGPPCAFLNACWITYLSKNTKLFQRK